MKILCLIDGLNPGGAQRQLVGLACMLKHKGYDVAFMWYHKVNFYEYQLEANNVQTIQLSPSNFIQKIWCLSKSIVSLKPDVIISYIDGPTMLTSFLKMMGIYKAKLIVSERNTTQIINYHTKIKFWLYEYADYVVPNSYSQASFIGQNYHRLKLKLFTITNFVDTELFVPGNRNREISDIIRIVVVGRIHPQKNILKFIEAVKLLKEERNDFQINWYGTSLHNEDYYEKIKRIKDEYHLGDTLVFNEPVRDIVTIYQQSDFFCLPSLYEGYPNVICEAMSCGLPIACSNVCDNSKIIVDGVNGCLFNPNDVKDMAAKIKMLFGLSGEQRRKFGEQSRKLALQKFSSKQFVKQYEDLFF